MDDEKYERLLTQYDDDALLIECKIIERLWDIDDITGSLLIEELDSLQGAIYRVLMKKFIHGDLVPRKSGIVCDMKLVK